MVSLPEYYEEVDHQKVAALYPHRDPTPSSGRNAFCLVLHGVGPATWHLFRPLRDQIDAIGGVPASLLIAPAGHDGESLADDLRFCAAMDRRLLQGDELVLNGYGSGLGDALDQSLACDSPLESSDARAREEGVPPRSERQARLGLRAGLHQFMELDWPVDGFVPPGWHLSKGVRAALRSLPFSYTADREGLIRLEDGRLLPTPAAVGSDLGAPWTTALSTASPSSSPEHFAHAPCLRLAVHPLDMQYSDGRDLWMRTLNKVLAERHPLTLADWLAHTDASASQLAKP